MIYLAVFLALLPFLFPPSVSAVCPVCTIAVGAGLGLSRYFGIDDLISGIWVGGLILSSSIWLINWLKEKKPNLPITKYQIPIILLMYGVVLLPLYWTNIIGHPANEVLGIDKLVLGSLIGSAGFLGGMYIDKKIREIRGKQFFNYQKVVSPILALVILSLVLYLYGGYLYQL